MHIYLISWDISFYGMQQRQADALDRKIVFLGPFAICESRQYGSIMWKDDHDELNKCSTCQAKLETRKKLHKKNRKKSWCLHIASDATVAGQGCHMGTIPLPVSVVSIICYNIHLLRVNAYEIIYDILAENTELHL